jgi:hypothetical protein
MLRHGRVSTFALLIILLAFLSNIPPIDVDSFDELKMSVAGMEEKVE